MRSCLHTCFETRNQDWLLLEAGERRVGSIQYWHPLTDVETSPNVGGLAVLRGGTTLSDNRQTAKIL